jgi:hypothetical protein
MQIHLHEVKILQIHNVRPEFVKNITAINQSESSITFLHGICKIVFAIFTVHRDACNKICKTLSVVRFMQHHSIELNRYIMLGPENDKQKVLFI